MTSQRDFGFYKIGFSFFFFSFIRREPLYLNNSIEITPTFCVDLEHTSHLLETCDVILWNVNH